GCGLRRRRSGPRPGRRGRPPAGPAPGCAPHRTRNGRAAPATRCNPGPAPPTSCPRSLGDVAWPGIPLRATGKRATAEIRTKSAGEQAHEGAGAQDVSAQRVADLPGVGVRVQAQSRVDGVQPEEVAVWVVAHGRTGAAPASFAVVVARGR